jgi:hypothetical protein
MRGSFIFRAQDIWHFAAERQKKCIHNETIFPHGKLHSVTTRTRDIYPNSAYDAAVVVNGPLAIIPIPLVSTGAELHALAALGPLTI